jgi:nicotinate (nicotinamide) nucleotide adenylyltransferase
VRRPVLAVLGGSFDPPHLGHVLMPTYVLARGLASRLLVAPTWSHPFAKRMSPFLDRLAWTRAAMAVHGARVEVSDIERRLAEARGVEAPSYTYDLLCAVQAEHPTYRVRLVVGSDIDSEIKRWHNYDRLVAAFPPIVVPRMGYADPKQCALPEISSTAVRGWLASPDNPAARAALEATVPAPVLERLRAGHRGHIWLIGHGNVTAHAESWLYSRGWTSTVIGARGLLTGTEELPGMASRQDTASGPIPRVPKAIWILCQDPQLGAVAATLAGIGLRPVPVLHAAGALPAREALAPLARAGFPVGTLHPIVSLRKEVPAGALDQCSFGVEGDAAAREFALRLIEDQPFLDLQGQDAAQRTRYHAACALAANHLAVLLAESRDVLAAQGHPLEAVERALAVLMRSSLHNLLTLGLPKGVTGPVVRGDAGTVARHVDALDGPARQVYALLSERLTAVVHPA